MIATSADYLLLEVSPTSTKCEVRDAWHALASRLHPDHGGDATTFSSAREAYTRILERAPNVAPCVRCSGLGRVVVGNNGFYGVLADCPDCRGCGESPNR